MDQTRAREIARDAAEQAGKTANEAAQRALGAKRFRPDLDRDLGQLPGSLYGPSPSTRR